MLICEKSAKFTSAFLNWMNFMPSGDANKSVLIKIFNLGEDLSARSGELALNT